MNLITVTPSVVHGRGFDYAIKTSFHSVFPAITVMFRHDGKAYGSTKRVSVVYGSGGIESPESDIEEACFSEQMAMAWRASEAICRHHIASSDVFRLPNPSDQRAGGEQYRWRW